MARVYLIHKSLPIVFVLCVTHPVVKSKFAHVVFFVYSTLHMLMTFRIVWVMSHFVFITVDWLTVQEFESGVVPYIASGRQLLDTSLCALYCSELFARYPVRIFGAVMN